MLAVEAGIIFIAFVLRWTKQTKDTSKWVHRQWQQLKTGLPETVMKKFTKDQTKALTKNARKLRKQQRVKHRKELAMVIGESRQIAQVRTHRHQSKTGEAFARLKCLFPYTPDITVKRMIRVSATWQQWWSLLERSTLNVRFDRVHSCACGWVWRQLSPNEEAAVARLLALGQPMWQIRDYKTLRYAIRRHLKKQLMVPPCLPCSFLMI